MNNTNMAREWLKVSKIDLEVIKEIINNETLTTVVAFHAQQSIEKSLKAILEFKNLNVPKIHNIKKLYILTQSEYSFSIDLDIVSIIDTLYIESRYPGDMGLLPCGKPSLKDSKEFYDFAQEIFEKVCKILEIDIKEVKV